MQFNLTYPNINLQLFDFWGSITITTPGLVYRKIIIIVVDFFKISVSDFSFGFINTYNMIKAECYIKKFYAHTHFTQLFV